MEEFGIHPNLTYHMDERVHMPETQDAGMAASLYGDIDHTPKAIALIVLAALGVVWGLNALGFRFSFGASVGR